MNHRPMSLIGLAVVAVGLVLWATMALHAQPAATAPAADKPDDAPATVSLSVKTLSGAEISVPHADRASIVLFVRSDQEQSTQTIDNLKKVLKDTPAAQVVAILSGQQDADGLKRFSAKLPWPLVHDADFGIVGQFTIRVWPTTVVVLSDGRELTRLSGMPPTYVSDLKAYLEFAADKIDRKTLQRRLSTSGVVGDSPYQIAQRHLRVAQRLLERDELELASMELEQGLRAEPGEPSLLLAKARTLLLLSKPDKAMDVIGRLDETSALSASIGILKGWARVAMKQWDLAIQTLEVAVKLNPKPAEGYYLLGVAYQQKGRLAEAVDAFSKAYVSELPGRLVYRSLHPPKPAPATQPAPTSQPAAAP